MIIRSLVLMICHLTTVLAFKLIFDYSNPDQWNKDHPQCAGYLQSPVVIAASRSVAVPLPALELVGYHDFLPPPLILKNNGHTVSMKIRNETSNKRPPYIFGAVHKEEDIYELESFHFHWGARNSRGSEHVLHGTRYPMEMHLVHRNQKYKNLESAILHDDGLTVLGVFFHMEEEDNNHLKPLIAKLGDIQAANSETKLDYTFKLSSLLPVHMEIYYTYKGSLTTPPCNEAVTWIIFADSVPISFKQMSKFRLLSNGKAILADNYRALQDLGTRKVYVRRASSNYMSIKEISDVDVSSLKWHWQ